MKNNYNIILLIITIISNTNNYAQTPGTMEFGNSLEVLANTTNPSVDQSVNSLLNNFNVSGVSSETTTPIFLALAPSGNGAGTAALATETDAVLGWFGNGNVAVSSGTLATSGGTEIGINTLNFAYERAVGNETLNFTFTGKKDGIEVGTLQIEMPEHKTLLSIDLSNTTTGTFSDIDEIVITPESPIFGGFTIDNLEIATATVVSSTYTWSGTTNNNWQIASNWLGNAVPPISANVIVPNNVTNYPTISAAVTVSSINIASGASLIAAASVTGQVTYNRNLPTTNWYLVSAPVSGETQQDVIANHTFATGSGSNIGIGTFTNNGTTAWTYATNATTGPLVSGAGTSIKLAAAGNLSMTGNFNTTNASFPVAIGSRNNFNLIGNPFTSYINSATLAGSNSVIENATFWLWDGSQYITYNNASDINIAPAQGFFIEANADTNVIFSTANQSHQNTDTFQKQIANTSFKLFAESKDAKRSTQVFYIDGKTTGHDSGYDSKIFGGATHSFAVFTELLSNNDGSKLAIQTLPNENYDSMVIPVGIIGKAGEEITFSTETTNFPTGFDLLLEDSINGTFTKLNTTNGTYTITLNEDVNSVGRFYIHTTGKSVLNADEETGYKKVNIYKTNNNTLKITGLSDKETVVKLFSITGKLVLNTSIKAKKTTEIKLNTALSKGVYIVKVQTDNNNITKKINVN